MEGLNFEASTPKPVQERQLENKEKKSQLPEEVFSWGDSELSGYGEAFNLFKENRVPTIIIEGEGFSAKSIQIFENGAIVHIPQVESGDYLGPKYQVLERSKIKQFLVESKEALEEKMQVLKMRTQGVEDALNNL